MSESLNYVVNQITKLEDDLQHYTMVYKDRALASQIKYDLEQFKLIENELKVLDIFKNALTIEHCPISVEPLKNDDKDFVGTLFRNITTIRTNELDKALRETLRKWVLKNAFPKELKALEAIKRNPMLMFHLVEKNATYQYVVEVTSENERPTQEEYESLKEILSND